MTVNTIGVVGVIGAGVVGREIAYAAAWGGYRTHLKNMLGGLGAAYIDASHWMPGESSFIDPLHLSWEGSQAFSRRLGEYLRNTGT